MIPRGPELDAQVTADVEVANVLDQLDEHLSVLGRDELRVLERIARRLRIGQQQYGALHVDTDPRDWREELAQELLDGCVYAAIATLVRPR